MATSRQREEEMLKKQIAGSNLSGEMGQTIKPRNEIEMLQHQLERAKDRIDEQNEELLGLYRRLHACDSPSRY